jgi:hypothetical protein
MRRIVLSCALLGACNAFPESLRSEIPVESTLPDGGAADAADAARIVKAPPTATFWSENGHAYEVISTSNALTFDNARLNAEEKGGHLVTFSSLAESTFVKQLMSKASASEAWIGAYQTPGSTEPDGGWAWVTGEPWAFTRWDTGEPSNNEGNEDFAVARASGEWNDSTATASYLVSDYVIEYE